MRIVHAPYSHKGSQNLTPGPTEDVLEQGESSAPASSAPGVNDKKEDWVTYAVSQGLEQDEAEALTKADLIEKFKP